MFIKYFVHIVSYENLSKKKTLTKLYRQMRKGNSEHNARLFENQFGQFVFGFFPQHLKNK